MIDIKGLDKAEVLKALYDASHVQGMGFLQAVPDGYVTVELCRELLDRNPCAYFDYMHGRVMKVDLSGDSFDERLYDRDNGIGAAESVIRRLRCNNDRTISGSFMCDTATDGVEVRIIREYYRDVFEIKFDSIKALDNFISSCKNLRSKMEAALR